ncbi:hypothetical protein BDZ97DRAFT_1655263 [Flammula alnicola]|nr:hypothetical protein BDZ97DRAFT_1655263 [Flammula alnicola]
MGQRHQAYIIARVVPHGSPPDKANYRCIGAIHHQWCYGRLPLKAAIRFMTLVKQKDNAEIVREEVHALNGLYGSAMAEAPTIPDVPCPFTSFLLASAFSADLSDPEKWYGSSIIYESAKMGTLEGDNNDGITVIDVTDPDSFLFLDDCERETPVPIMAPISAEQYVRAYYSAPNDPNDSDAEGNIPAVELDVLSTIRPFESIPTIPMQKISEAWPTEYGIRQHSSEPLQDESFAEVAIGLPSLVDLTFGPAVELGLRSNEREKLELLLSLPEKSGRTKEILRSQCPLSETGIYLLSKILAFDLERGKVVDLSGFHLTSEEVVALLSPHGDVEVLNISNNYQMNIDTVDKLLSLIPSLRRFVVWNTAVTNSQVMDLLKRKPEFFRRRLEGFIHPAFMKLHDEFSEPKLYDEFAEFKSTAPIAFAQICQAKYGGGTSSVSLPYFTPGQIAQALADFLSPLASDHDVNNIIYSMGRSCPIVAACACHVRQEGESWGERAVTLIPTGLLTSIKKALMNYQGWIFLFIERDGVIQYTFLRRNLEVFDQFEKDLKEVWPPEARSPPAKEVQAIKHSYATKGRLYHVYDIHDFFKQLESEGRPPAAPKTLRRLFDLFSTASNRDGHGSLKLMTYETVLSYL